MLSDVDKKKIKSIFSEYLDFLDSKKTINEQIKDLIEEVSSISGFGKKIIRKAFSFLKKQYEDADNELDDITNLVVELQDAGKINK